MKKSLAILFLFSSILPAFAGDGLSSQIPCPDGGTKIRSHICCKNGYAMDETTGLYSKKEPLCK